MSMSQTTKNALDAVSAPILVPAVSGPCIRIDSEQSRFRRQTVTNKAHPILDGLYSFKRIAFLKQNPKDDLAPVVISKARSQQ